MNGTLQQRVGWEITGCTWDALWRPQDRMARVALHEGEQQIKCVGEESTQDGSEMPFSTSFHSHQEITYRRGGQEGCVERASAEVRGPVKLAAPGTPGTAIHARSLGPRELKMRETGLENHKGPLQLSDFTISGLLCMSYSRKNHSLHFSQGRGKKPDLLFTVYSRINSNELAKNCSSLLSRLICQYFFFLLLMRALHLEPLKIIIFWGWGIKGAGGSKQCPN